MLTEKVIAAIEKCLADGCRAEVVPVKYGAVVLKIHKEKVLDPKKNK